MANMHLYSDGTDTYSAESLENAIELRNYNVSDCYLCDELYEVDDDKDIEILFEDEIKEEFLPENAVQVEIDPQKNHGFYFSVTAKAKAWAEKSPNSFICSTEF